MDVDLRSPTPPLRPIAFIRWLWRLILDIADEWSKDGVGDLAASITFWTTVSVPAAALALVSALSSLENLAGAKVAREVRETAIEFANDTFRDSKTIRSTINDLFDTSSTGIATVATAVAVFTLSRAFAGLIRALDRAYGVESGRPWWYLRIVAVGLGLGTIGILAAAATVLTMLPTIPFTGDVPWFTVVLVFLGITIWIAMIFHLAPNHRTPWRYDLPGALVTSIGWFLAVQLFTLYVQYAGSGNQVQSSVGAILLALTLMYALSVIMLVGAELNDVIVKRTESATQNTDITERMKSARDWWRDRWTEE